MVSIRFLSVALALAASPVALADPTSATTGDSHALAELASQGRTVETAIDSQLRQVELTPRAAVTDGLQASCLSHTLDLAPRLRAAASSALAALQAAERANDKPGAIVQLALLDATAKIKSAESVCPATTVMLFVVEVNPTLVTFKV